VIAEYDVFITPDLEEQIYLLQYPNRLRDDPYNASRGNAPLEMRLKPNAGFVEVDIPLNVVEYFDKLKGIKFGEALRKAKEDGQNAFGVAAGFERMPIPPSAAGRDGHEDALADQNLENLMQRFEDANDRGHVMNKQTLGGQILRRDVGDPMYMLGAFRGSELPLRNAYHSS
jgi:DNA-directed RNA polymerase III subunit RPC5